MSGSRALKTRTDVFVEGSDEDAPRYATIGRTLRRSDRIGKPFVVAIEHQDDNDDAVAKTFVRARFDGEQTERGTLSKSALRVLDELKDRADPAKRGGLRKVLRMNDSILKGALEELRDAGLAECRDEAWRVSTSHFLASLGEAPARAEDDLNRTF